MGSRAIPSAFEPLPSRRRWNGDPSLIDMPKIDRSSLSCESSSESGRTKACCFPKCLRFGIPYSYVRDPISIHQKGNSACQAFSFHRVGLSRDLLQKVTSENSYIYDSMMRCAKNHSGSINTFFLVPMRCATSPQRRRRGRMPLESSFTIAFKLESPSLMEVAWFV